MNFSEVTQIAISEGNVTQIKVGDVVLYKEQLVCEPEFTFSALAGYLNSSSAKRLKATLHLSGISRSLITKIQLLYIKTSKLTTGQELKTTTTSRTAMTLNQSAIALLDTVNGCERSLEMAPTDTTTSYTFRWYMEYTDLNGETQTVYTEQKAGTYNSLKS